MNLYLGNDTKNGDVMLKATDEVKLDKTDIYVDIATGEKPKLTVDDKVTLLENDVNSKRLLILSSFVQQA